MRLLLMVLLVACTPRKVPVFPLDRPLPSEGVTLVLDGDPPLPGEDVGGWRALEADLLAQPLTVDRAEAIALMNDHATRAALLEVDAFRGRAVQAGLLPNPEVEFSTNAHTKEVAIGFDLTSAVLAGLAEGVGNAEVEAARRVAAAAVVRRRTEVRVVSAA